MSLTKEEKKQKDAEMIKYIYDKYQFNKELTKDDLRFLYNIGRKFGKDGDYLIDPRLNEIIRNRDVNEDLKVVFDPEETIEGDLCIFDAIDLEGITFPKKVTGTILMPNIKSATNVVFPKEVEGGVIYQALEETK